MLDNDARATSRCAPPRWPVTIDTTAPTVTDPNISVTLTTDNGVKGLAEYGDTVTIVWDNSAGGDNNTDVSSVAVDLSQYGVTTGLATMYDDGTHGDATAGDGVWTLAYTITSTNISMQHAQRRCLRNRHRRQRGRRA